MMILARDAGSVRDLQISENNGVVNPKDAFPWTCTGDSSEGTCIPLDTGRGCAGTT